MADSLDSRHGTSDEFIDPHCDPCYEDEGKTVKVRGFCKDCAQFLCSDCHRVHRNIQSCRHHDLIQGEDMPKSQTDKPPRFEYCNVHPKSLKDVFCCEHKILLCSLCSSSNHKGCSIKTVQDACEIVDVSETGALYDKIKKIQENLKSALHAIIKDIDKTKDQQKSMLRDAQKMYDQVTEKLNKMFNDIKKDIQTSCQFQIDRLSHQRTKFIDKVAKLEPPLARLRELKAITIDTKVVLRLQEIVTSTKIVTTDLQDSHKQHKYTLLSFIPSQPVQEFLSSLFAFGQIRRLDSKSDADIVIPEILFPVSSLKQRAARPKTGRTRDPQNTRPLATKPLFSKTSQQLSEIKATKQGSFNIKQKNVGSRYWITGVAIIKYERILMTDYNNVKVRMFSRDMKFLSSVSVPDRPWDIAMVSDKEVVVTTVNKSLVILRVSDSQLSIKTTIQIHYDVHGISQYDDKLVVTSSKSNPPFVMLIDKAGTVNWSVSSDQRGQPLFRQPWYVSSHGDGKSSTVIVTDEGNHTLTLLNGDTGEVITRRQLKEKCPEGVTTDSDGNVFVCYCGTSEVAVLSGDLSEEKILLSSQDGLSDHPQAIVYDDKAHRLIISGCNPVDVFQLS